jgi:hypothetical protein
LLTLTHVTPPDYFNSAGDKIAVFGSDNFQNQVKENIYKVWPDREVTLYSSTYVNNNSDWILHAASVAHFIIIEINLMYVLPLWLAEYCCDKPRIYVGSDKSTSFVILNRKNPRLTVESVEDAVGIAIKTLA